MPVFWGYMIPLIPFRRHLVIAAIDSNNNFNYPSHLTKVSNCVNKSNKYSSENKTEKIDKASPIVMVSKTGKVQPQVFKQLFVEHCLSNFFSLNRGNGGYTQEKFLSAKEAWIQSTIKLYACSHYIVNHYIEVCEMQKETNTKKFHKHMKQLSKLMIEGHFYKVSKFSYVIDENHEDYPRLKKLLEKIGGEIVEIFDNNSGPSDRIIGLLLSNHSVQIAKNRYAKIVVNHTRAADITIAHKMINIRNNRIRQRNSSSTSYTGEHLIRLIGIRTQNQCLKRGENK